MNILVSPKKFQREVFDDSLDLNISTKVLVAGRQSGKSYILRAICINWCKIPNTVVAYICPEYRLAYKFFTSLTEVLGSLVKSQGSRLIIKFKNGSRIEFLSVGSGDRIRGNTYDYVICDEVAFYPESTPDGQSIMNDIILPTLDDHGKQLMLVSTPHGAMGYFYEQYIKALQGSQGYSLTIHPITEDEARSPEWLEAKKASVPLSTWRQEYCCEFLASGYSFFTDCYSSNFINSDKYLDPNSPLVVGIDGAVGGSDPCSVTILDQHLNCVQFNLTLPVQNKIQMALDVARCLDPFMSRIQRVYVENVNPSCFYQDIQLQCPSWFRSKIKPTNGWSSNASKLQSCQTLNSYLSDIHFETSNTAAKLQLDNFVVLKVTNSKNLILGNASPKIHDDAVASLCHAIQAWEDQFSKRSHSMLVG